jgi:hypothetical protein
MSNTKQAKTSAASTFNDADRWLRERWDEQLKESGVDENQTVLSINENQTDENENMNPVKAGASGVSMREGLGAREGERTECVAVGFAVEHVAVGSVGVGKGGGVGAVCMLLVQEGLFSDTTLIEKSSLALNEADPCEPARQTARQRVARKKRADASIAQGAKDRAAAVTAASGKFDAPRAKREARRRVAERREKMAAAALAAAREAGKVVRPAAFDAAKAAEKARLRAVEWQRSQVAAEAIACAQTRPQAEVSALYEAAQRTAQQRVALKKRADAAKARKVAAEAAGGGARRKMFDMPRAARKAHLRVLGVVERRVLEAAAALAAALAVEVAARRAPFDAAKVAWTAQLRATERRQRLPPWVAW